MSETNGNRLVPLYEELNRYSVIGPIMNERMRESTQSDNTQTNKAQPNTTQSNSAQSNVAQSDAKSNSADRAASNQSSSATSANASPTVRSVTGEYTSAALDVRLAKEHLDAAKEAVENDDFKVADGALVAVQNGLVVTTVVTEMPLVQARANLFLARENADRGNIAAAQAALKASSQALAEYGKGQSRYATQARELQMQIDNFKLQENAADAGSKIDSWWDQTTEWMTPADDE